MKNSEKKKHIYLKNYPMSIESFKRLYDSGMQKP